MEIRTEKDLTRRVINAHMFSHLSLMKAAKTSLTSSYSEAPSLLFSPRSIAEEFEVPGPIFFDWEVRMLEEEGTDFSLLDTLPTALSFSTISVDAEVLVSVLSSYGMPSYPTSHRAGTVQYRDAGGPPAPWSD